MENVIKTFENFVHWANFGGLHPNDEERFYKFIVESYTLKYKIEYERFAEIIKEKAPSLDEDDIRKYYARYERGLDLVRVCKTGYMFER